MGEIVNGKIEGACAPCEPIFLFAINCRDESVF